MMMSGLLKNQRSENLCQSSIKEMSNLTPASQRKTTQVEELGRGRAGVKQ